VQHQSETQCFRDHHCLHIQGETWSNFLTQTHTHTCFSVTESPASHNNHHYVS